METTLKLQVSDVHIGNINTLSAFESFLYAGENVETLITQPVQAKVKGLGEAGVWVVNPEFQAQYSDPIMGEMRIIADGDDWSLQALQAVGLIWEQQPAEAVYIAAANKHGHRIVFRVGKDVRPDQPCVDVNLINLSERRQAVFQALEAVGQLELLTVSQNNPLHAQDVLGQLDERFVQMDHCAVSLNLFTETTALSELFQCLRGWLSIQHRTRYGHQQAVSFGRLSGYTRSVPWFLSKGIAERSVLLLGEKSESGSMAIQLKEPLVPDSTVSSVRMHRKVRLVVVCGNQAEKLIQRIEAVQEMVQSGHSLAEIEAQTQSWLQGAPSYRAVLIANDCDQLKSELELARKGIPSSLQSGRDWNSMGGSFFTPNPLGETSKIAFVYPGAFNSYIGMGAELLHCYPFLHDWLSAHTEDAAETFQASKVFPPSWGTASAEELETLQRSLLDSPLSMLFSGTAIAGLYTHLLRSEFGVDPEAAFGYSMGETSMFFASGFWQQTGAMKTEIAALPLFHNRLAGSIDAVREAWNAMGYAIPAGPQPIWDNYILMTTFEKALQVVGAEPQVYITHINAARQVVIGGEPAACKRVLAELRCMSFPIPFHYPMHCEAIASEYETLRDLHLQPVEDENSIQYYCTFECAPFTLESSTIAEAIAGGLCNRVDFPALVDRVYQDGHTLFIEVGARSNCAKWIENRLKSKQVCAVSVNQAEVPDEISLMKVLARLISHGKTVRLPDSKPLDQHSTDQTQTYEVAAGYPVRG